MNYYEEFGVSPEASSEEIRRAYKALVRLVHPDVQADNDVRKAAEREMKRINEIFEVLANPQKRRLYDEALSAKRLNRPTPTAISKIEPIPEPRWTRKLLEQWYWIVLGAMVVALSVWYITTPKPSEIEARPSVAASTTVRDQPQQASTVENKSDHMEVTEKLARVPPTAEAPIQKLDNKSESPDLASVSTREQIKLPDIKLEQKPEIAPILSSTAPKTQAIKTQTTAVEDTSLKWAGNWLSAGSSIEAKKLQYVAEYVELTLIQEDGKISGNYWARYRIPDQAISSEVRLHLQGNSPRDNTATLKWTSADGAEGESQLILESQDVMTLNWWTTQFGKTVGLSSGMARLVRQRRR